MILNMIIKFRFGLTIGKSFEMDKKILIRTRRPYKDNLTLVKNNNNKYRQKGREDRVTDGPYITPGLKFDFRSGGFHPSSEFERILENLCFTRTISRLIKSMVLPLLTLGFSTYWDNNKKNTQRVSSGQDWTISSKTTMNPFHSLPYHHSVTPSSIKRR